MGNELKGMAMTGAAPEMLPANGLRGAWTRAKSLARLKPDFFIVGGQRCGTTSLYHYLVRHPCVLPAEKKEIHFFSDHFQQGERWYRCHFASLINAYGHALYRRHRVITGEATPNYLFHPHVPRRVKQFYPNAKVIVLLRNPVDRAFSHYHYHVKLGVEKLGFEQAIAAEPERLKGELDKMLRDEHYFSFNYKMFSYLQRGHYVEQLRRWSGLFPKDQILVLSSEAFFADPAEAYGQVQRFLRLPVLEFSSFKKLNEGMSGGMSPETRARLIEHFRPHNRELYEYLGTDFGWDR
jgi:hypothetical protein